MTEDAAGARSQTVVHNQESNQQTESVEIELGEPKKLNENVESDRSKQEPQTGSLPTEPADVKSQINRTRTKLIKLEAEVAAAKALFQTLREYSGKSVDARDIQEDLKARLALLTADREVLETQMGELLDGGEKHKNTSRDIAKIKRAVSYRPKQPNVDYAQPTELQLLRLISLSGNETGKRYPGFELTDSNGNTLREFLDTNRDGNLDIWIYFKDGRETYRDVDRNFDGKIDESHFTHYVPHPVSSPGKK